MTPRRGAELIDTGSLYWVIRGVIQCRQKILDLQAVTGEDGVKRCRIVLDPELVAVEPRPRSAFQGWRYLQGKDAPRDLAAIGGDDDPMPAEMRRELAELGLL